VLPLLAFLEKTNLFFINGCFGPFDMGNIGLIDIGE
jgi:hypothetical protein